MVALVFPPNPQQNDFFTASNGVVYVYDGVKWVVQGSTFSSSSSVNFVQDSIAPLFTNIVSDGISFAYDAETNVLSATLGKFKIDTDSGTAILTTISEIGYSYGHDIAIAPSGEGNNIYIPNQANAILGQPISISANENSSVEIGTDSGTWTFGTDGRGPATSISLNPGPTVGYTTASNVPTNTDSSTGFGLTVDIVADGFSISSVVINQPGQGYAIGDQLQIDQLGSTGTGEITVTGVSSNTPVITLPYGHTIGSGSSDGIKLTTDRGTILLGNTPECGTTTHFHIMKQDPYHVDLFLGDDLNYVKLKGYENIPPSMPYGVEIGTNDGSAQLWRFGTDGTTTFPRNTIDSGANEIALKSHKYSELHWQSDQLVSQVNAPSDNFVGVDDQGAYISTVGTEYANTWAFGNNGTLRFPDGTVQTTAYDSMPLDNIGIDGGAASAVYEVSRLFADGGSAGNRFGPNDPIFDGTSAGVVYGPSDLVLNGGVA